MRHKGFILTALFLLSLGSAQAQVYEMPSFISNESVVRWWKDSTILVYTWQSSTLHGFLLYTKGQTAAQFIDYSDAGARALYVGGSYSAVDNCGFFYFCGNNGSQAAVGGFAIPSLPSGGPVYHTWLPHIDVFDMDSVAFTRMELFEDSGLVCLALVGETKVGSTVNMPNTTVATEFLIPGSMAWYGCLIYNKDSVVRYTDITCLDSVIVAVGTRADHIGCCYRPFEKSWHFPTNPLLTNSAVEIISGSRALEKVLARKIAGDRMALAFLAK